MVRFLTFGRPKSQKRCLVQSTVERSRPSLTSVTGNPQRSSVPKTTNKWYVHHSLVQSNDGFCALQLCDYVDAFTPFILSQVYCSNAYQGISAASACNADDVCVATVSPGYSCNATPDERRKSRIAAEKVRPTSALIIFKVI